MTNFESRKKIFCQGKYSGQKNTEKKPWKYAGPGCGPGDQIMAQAVVLIQFHLVLLYRAAKPNYDTWSFVM